MSTSTSTAAPAPIQCTSCFRARVACSPVRPCVRCVDSGVASTCVDVSPPCVPCQTTRQLCDRSRPCSRCIKGNQTESCIDGEHEQVVRTQGGICMSCQQRKWGCDRNAPCNRCINRGEEENCVDPVISRQSERGASTQTGERRRLTEGERLMLEMEQSENRKRKTDRQTQQTQQHTGSDTENAHTQTQTQEEAINEEKPLEEEMESSQPQHPPPQLDTSVEALQWWNTHGQATDTYRDRATDTDTPTPLSTRQTPLSLISASPDSLDPLCPTSFPVGFVCDFSLLLPRCPVMSLSASPVHFLNLWGRFMSSHRHTIDGAMVHIQQRHVTPFDVYRSVVLHGGYAHVIKHHLYHSVVADVILKAASVMTPNLPLLPVPPASSSQPVLVSSPVSPRSFLVDYYDRFLYHFEHRYQWNPPSSALSTIALSVRPIYTQIQALYPLSKKPKSVAQMKIDLLKRLWTPQIHTQMFKAEYYQQHHYSKEESQLHLTLKQKQQLLSITNAQPLGYRGIKQLKTNLLSGILPCVTEALNTLLLLTAAAASAKQGMDDDATDINDDDDNGSDVYLIFHFNLINELLELIQYPYGTREHNTRNTGLFSLITKAKVEQRVTNWPDLHTAALVILHNLSAIHRVHHLLTKHSHLINTCTSIIGTSGKALCSCYVDPRSTAQICMEIMQNISTCLDLTQCLNSGDWMKESMDILSDYQHCWLHQDIGQLNPLADKLIGIFHSMMSLVCNPHHSNNLEEMQRLLPQAFAEQLLSISCCPPDSLSVALPDQIKSACVNARLSCLELLVFLCLSSRVYADAVLHAGGLYQLLHVICEGGESTTDRQLRTSAAACIQAVIAYSLTRDQQQKTNRTFDLIRPLEAGMFTACSKDTDVALLLNPVLQKATHQADKEKITTSR